MEQKRTSVFENGLIWFGAAVSIAEILTGTAFAPLGLGKGLLAIVLGHIIGCALLFFAGLIGGKMRESSMEITKRSFGEKGGLLFSVLNIVQLVGWTAIMIYDGAGAAGGIRGANMKWVWRLLIGGLIAALFILTVILSFIIFGDGTVHEAAGEAMSFGAALELSVAMPLSWLPLISDYTRDAEKPVRATAVSAVVYGIVSCWMYLIGMGSAIFTAESDIAAIVVKAGLGVVGLLIIVFSTVTTTFLDAYSAGVSSESVSKKLRGKTVGIIVAVIGTVGAIFFPMDDITDFLYFIGSVFAPMIAVLIADFFLLRRTGEKRAFDIRNLVIWAAGFVIYRLLMRVDIPVGYTVPDMLATVALCLLTARLFAGSDRKAKTSAEA